ncbi:hypothetical protein BH11PSE8_BH11PSE8_45000 [soil metagenome]
MLDERSVNSANATTSGEPKQGAIAGGKSGSDTYQTLRKLGGIAHQLRAASRAADYYLAMEDSDDSNTGSWLISSAFGVAEELAADLDNLAKTLKDRPADAGLAQPLRALRTRAHQLHAATKAADHFLDQESSEDRGTGSWLIAYALGLADKLAAEMDDVASSLKRPGSDTPQGFSDVNMAQRAGNLRNVAA